MDTEPQTATNVAEDDEYAILFPGQGSQSVGMAGKVLEVYPGAAHWFERANQILDYDLLDLIERGPAAELNDTQHSQPAIFVASVAWLEALREKWNAVGRALTPTVVSGHSMGQITAMLAARALDFDEALQLVRRRGELMREANLRRPGGMASIIGLRDRVLRSLVGEVGNDGTIVVANDNCPGQTVVSGDEAPLRRLMRLAEEHGARRVVRLPISIASHSPLMEDAQTQFRQAVNAVNWRDPVVPVVSNISAGLMHQREQLIQELSGALTAPVQWQAAVRTMAAQGSTLFVEAGPGDVLSKLVRRISRSSWTFPLSDDEAGLGRRNYPDKSDGIPK
jgi:[acyl-carrier-protein] S-malonyltransferase